MELDRPKLKALVLYVIWRTSETRDFGLTKLNKVLWFSDARAFQALGKPITGETYVRQKFGPVPEHAAEIINELEAEGVVETWTEPYFDFEVKRFKAHEPADLSIFNADELNLIDWWIKTVSEHHTAMSISELSHDYGWKIAKMGERLPLYAFLAGSIRHSREGEELDWARDKAKQTGRP